MSGKRGPMRSSLGPIRGLAPVKLMWSSTIISVPAIISGVSPPEALVRMRRSTPNFLSIRMGTAMAQAGWPS